MHVRPTSVFLTLFLFVVNITSLTAQEGFPIRTDPGNKNRSIIDLKPVVRTTVAPRQAGDVLTNSLRKQAIPFVAFEMRHPKTGKPLNPDAKMVYSLPDGTKREVTVKAFFDELNRLEKALNATGRSLRKVGSLSDLRPNFTPNSYQQIPKLAAGFETKSFKTYTASATAKPVVVGPITTNNTKIGTLTLVNWNSGLYIAERFENTGTTEFPAEWATSSNSGKGRKIFPLLIEVPKGFAPLVVKAEWQVADQPFSKQLKEEPKGLRKTGTLTKLNWTQAILGVVNLHNFDKNLYYNTNINIGEIEAEPANSVKTFYLRVLLYDKEGKLLNSTNSVLANYGGVSVPITVPIAQSESVPNFNYQYPENSDIPFGVFVRGQGFVVTKTGTITSEANKPSIQKYLGYRITADAKLGIRYFNFLHLIDDKEPKSNEFSLIGAKFMATGGTYNLYGKNEPAGVKLSLDILNGLEKPEIAFTKKIPGSDNISLEYKVNQPLDLKLVDVRFTIGPVPMRVAASIKGDAGIELYGHVSPATMNYEGSIKPYISTSFEATGGVDAVIAYATLNAEVNPLLKLTMPASFSSLGKPLSFATNLSGLNGRVFLAVGFYYPCPSLEKIVGFITGDEELPLCECRWEYNIFDFKGFEHSYSY